MARHRPLNTERPDEPRHMAARLHAEPPVDRDHGRTRKVVPHASRGVPEAGQAATLQHERRTEGSVPLGDAEVAEHPCNACAAGRVRGPRKRGRGAYDLVPRRVHGHPEAARAGRIGAIEPLEPVYRTGD